MGAAFGERVRDAAEEETCAQIRAALPPKVGLIATDLDGTLLGGSGEVSLRAREALRVIQSQGVHVVIATGRSAQDVRVLGRSLGCARYAVCLNGAVILDLGIEGDEGAGIASADVVSARILDANLVASLAARIRSAYPEVGLGIEQTSLRVARETGGTLFGPGWDEAYEEMSHEVLTSQPAMKLFVSSLQRSGVELQVMIEKLSLPEIALTRSTEVGFVEIACAGVSKGAALQEVCELLGVELSATIAMGDMPNDVEMLELAACGVAMGNADELVLEAARVQTLAHTEEGAALVLEAALEHVLAGSLA